MGKIRQIKQGETFVLTRGEYSCYELVGLFRASKDFDMDNIAEAVRKISIERDEFSWQDKVGAYITQNGYATELNYREWYLDY